MAIKCDGCGRFIAYKDLDSGAAKSHYTPDSDLSTEGIRFECPKCAIKEF